MTFAAHAARLALGLIFLAAAFLKSLDVAEFARQTAEYGVIGPDLATIAAPLLIVLEGTLGVALIAGWRVRAAAAALGAMLVLFIALEAWGLAHGKTESCGCFGAYVQRTPTQVILEDILFLGLAVLTFAELGSWQARRARLAAACVAASAALFLGFALASPHLPIDGLVTQLRVGRTAEELKIARYLPEDGQGRTLVALLDLTSPDAKQVSEALNALHDAPGAPAVIALTPSTEQEEAAFLWDAYPAFDIHPVDRGTLKRLYRRLPLYFLVSSGRVDRVFRTALPPASDLLSSEAS
jgi:putative oxidoreductase